MKQATVEEITNKAKVLVSQNTNWHFHILTPKCVFNDTDKFALVLENSTNPDPLINYSDVRQDEVGKVLLELLHGIKTDTKNEISGNISLQIKVMAQRAKDLTAKEIPWHHHALFPDCTFNKQQGKWVVMLEDPVTGEVLESITDNKPEADLKIIEPIFYHQKN